MSEASKRFLTAEDAATYLGGLNSRTVTRWAREGYLPAFPIGEGKRRLWRFRQTDLEEWMAGRRQGGQFPLAIQGTAGKLVRSHRCSSREKHD
jgi:excisionase family DNA binding protein